LLCTAHNFVDSQRNPGVWKIYNRINAANIQPAAHDAGANIRLVLMIRRHHFDLDTWAHRTKILDRHLRRNNGAWPRCIGVETRLVVQYAYSDDAIGDLGLRIRG